MDFAFHATVTLHVIMLSPVADVQDIIITNTVLSNITSFSSSAIEFL